MVMNEIDRIDRKTLLALTAKEGPPCISIYMGLVRAGREVQQNVIRLKDLIRRAGQKLARYGLPEAEVAALIAPLQALADDPVLWAQRPPGLAFFIAADRVDFYRLPVAFNPEVIVDQRFYIRPLLPLVALDAAGPLSVVLVGGAGARLLRCDSNECAEVLPPAHLRSFDEFMKHHDFEKSLQFSSQSGPPRRGEGGNPTYYGQGGGGDEAVDNRYLLDYYHQFKNWLGREISGQDILYVAGDERNDGLFQKAASELPQRIITLEQKHSSTLADEELFRLVREEMIRRQDEVAAQEYQRLERLEADDPQKTLHNPAPVIEAAHDKRIEVLFLPPEGRHLWGRYDLKHHRALIKRGPDIELGEELLNLAAIRTLQNGGRIIVSSGAHAGLGGDGTAAICHW